MSTHRASISEAELDAILRTLLQDAAAAPADRITAGAMAQVGTTRQVRGPLALRGPRRIQVSPLPAAAIAAGLVIAIGAMVVLPAIGPATPPPTASSSPSASPSPTVSPSAVPTPADELVFVGSTEDGWSMAIPASWTETPLLYDDARRWEGPDAMVTVSYGESILDGGKVTQCGPPALDLPLCAAEAYTYSIPFDPDTDGVGPLDLSGFLGDRCIGGCEVVTSETILGGEVASESDIVAGVRREIYVSTFHDRRPVIVNWSESASGPDGGATLDRMIESFQFLDAPVASVSPELDPTELVPYTNPELGYELLVPRFWEGGRDHPDHASVHEFGSGSGFNSGRPILTISVGSTAGAVTLCHQGVEPGCEVVVAKTLAGLEGQIMSVPEEFKDAVPPDVSGDIVLAGAAGLFKRPGYGPRSDSPGDFGIPSESSGGNCLGCPGMTYHAFAVVDGRPVVISFDWWTIGFNVLPADYLRDIVASFRLLDAPVPSPTPLDPTELVPYVNAALGYELLVPRSWGEGREIPGHPNVRAFDWGRGFGTRGRPALTVSIGDPDGTVTLCYQEVGPSCEDVVATTLAKVERQLVSIAHGFPGAEVSGDLVLAGVDGRFKRPDGGNNCLGCPGWQYHAFAVVDGRPVVISIDWWTIRFGDLPADYRNEILASFRFSD